MARVWMLAAGLVASACAGGVRTDFIDLHEGAYDGTTVQLAVSHGPIPVAVHGNLYPGVTGMAAAEAVVQHLRMPGWFPPARFKPASFAEVQRSDYSLVLVVDPARPITVEVCGDAEQLSLLAPTDEITVFAVFCSAGQMAMHSFARAGSSAPGTPAFQQLIEQISISVFPMPQFWD